MKVKLRKDWVLITSFQLQNAENLFAIFQRCVKENLSPFSICISKAEHELHESKEFCGPFYCLPFGQGTGSSEPWTGLVVASVPATRL